MISEGAEGSGPNPDVAQAGVAAEQPLRYITALNRNDVLLGRGRPVVRWEGNIRFRRLVQNRKAQYRATGRNIIKDNIAREIIQTVQSREGRFLRKIESLEEAIELGVPTGVQGWVVADDVAVLQKVKQAFRDEQRAELESEAENALSVSDRSHAHRAEQHASVRDPTDPSYPDAATQQLMLLMNRRAAASGRGGDAIDSDNPNPSLEQTLSMLRAAQSDTTSQQQQQRQHIEALNALQSLNPYTISQLQGGNSNDFSQLHSLLESGRGGRGLPPHLRESSFQSEQRLQQPLLPSLSSAGSNNETLSNILRARALVEMQEERQRQEQLQATLARLQNSRSGLSSAYYAGGDYAQPSFSQLAARQPPSELPQGMTALELELLAERRRSSLPFHPTERMTQQPSASLVQQIASAQALRNLGMPFLTPGTSLLQDVNDRGQAVARFPQSTDTLPTLQGLSSETDHTGSTTAADSTSALELLLRHRTTGDSDSKPPARER